MPVPESAEAAPLAPAVLASALRKVTWRLIPFLFVLYLVAYLDRVNVGFAQLQMKQSLSMSDAAYGFGAGLFFIPYFLCELPSNLLLQRFGPRRWMARIMVTWGVISSATMFVSGEVSFYLLRAALGVAEAGFFPGMILYLTYWFPPRERAAAFARFMTAIGLSLVIGGPLSGAIMDGLHGVHGWQGWQWLFLLEGLPSVLLGIVVLWILPDRPADVRWLSDPEKAALAEALRDPAAAPSAASSAAGRARHSHTLRDALVDARVWLLSLIYFIYAMALYGLTLWVPQIIKDVAGGSTLRVGLLSAIPYGLAVVCMVLWSQRTDRAAAYRGSLIVTTALAGLALGGAALLLGAGPVAILAALSLGVMALFSSGRCPPGSCGARPRPAALRSSTRSAISAASSVPGSSGPSRSTPARSRAGSA
jgi:sugar phosphate permease